MKSKINTSYRTTRFMQRDDKVNHSGSRYTQKHFLTEQANENRRRKKVFL